MDKCKKALVIMPAFYTYPSEITSELTTRGYEVDLYKESPGKMFFLVISNISKWVRSSFLYDLFCNLLYKKIARSNKKYNLLLVIRGNILNRKLIKKIKSNLLETNGYSAYYTWDSFKYLEHKGILGDEFDRKFSFDSEDVKNDPSWTLLPLFYIDKFSGSALENEGELIYDLCCVAGFNLYRYKTLKQIVAANPCLKIKVLLYINSDLYKYKKKTDPEYFNLDMSWITFEQLPSEQVASINKASKAVLDITDEYQSGLSMRTIEAVGLKNKLVTNNARIKEYDFYTPSNVLYVDSKSDYKIKSDWVNIPYIDNPVIREKYSLSSWMDQILNKTLS